MTSTVQLTPPCFKCLPFDRGRCSCCQDAKCYRYPVVSYPWIFRNQAQVLLQGMETAAAMPTLARPENLARVANRCRQSKRPQDPVDLDFTTDESSIPEGTNNDIEGWDHSLNRRAAGRCGLPLLMFEALLHKEARLVSRQIPLVSERNLRRMQRSTYREVQRRLFELWEAFNKKEKSLRQLLEGCANLDRPVMRLTELNLDIICIYY